MPSNFFDFLLSALMDILNRVIQSIVTMLVEMMSG